MEDKKNLAIPKGEIERIELPRDGFYDKIISLVEKARENGKTIILGVYDDLNGKEITQKRDN